MLAQKVADDWASWLFFSWPIDQQIFARAPISGCFIIAPLGGSGIALSPSIQPRIAQEPLFRLSTKPTAQKHSSWQISGSRLTLESLVCSFVEQPKLSLQIHSPPQKPLGDLIFPSRTFIPSLLAELPSFYRAPSPNRAPQCPPSAQWCDLAWSSSPGESLVAGRFGKSHPHGCRREPETSRIHAAGAPWRQE